MFLRKSAEPIEPARARAHAARFRPLAVVLAMGLVSASFVLAAPPARRAKPPRWEPSTIDVFFPDARQKLVGSRPVPGQDSDATSPGPAADEGSGPATAGGEFAWSKLISAEVIEDEVKATEQRLAADLANDNDFKGGGYKSARVNCSVLAVMFAIIAEYDGEVRWKSQAAGIRSGLAHAGFNCKVGTDQALKEARARSEDLQSLIRGGSVDVRAAERKAKWNEVSGRPPLMQRLEQAHHQGMTPWTSNQGEFSKNAAKLAHEAQITAALAEIIQREGFEFADDATYLGHARNIIKHALEVRAASQQNDYNGARTATGAIEKTCNACHEGYRG